MGKMNTLKDKIILFERILKMRGEFIQNVTYHNLDRHALIKTNKTIYYLLNKHTPILHWRELFPQLEQSGISVHIVESINLEIINWILDLSNKSGRITIAVVYEEVCYEINASTWAERAALHSLVRVIDRPMQDQLAQIKQEKVLCTYLLKGERTYIPQIKPNQKEELPLTMYDEN